MKKKALTTSIVLNITLAICLLALLKQRKPDLAPPASAAQTEIAVQQEPANTETIESAPKQVEPSEEQQAVAQTPWANQMKERPVTMPLVFQDVDLSQLKLNSEQLQALEDLRQKFLDEIGGSDQNPNDPAYKERWIKSQPEIDNDLRGFIGVTAFQDYQIEASTVGEKAP